METEVNEVTVVEQDLLMTVDEFAKQEGVTPRTVYRWIELGRLDTVERLGKKYVNASIPLKSGINEDDNVRNDKKSPNVTALQNINIFEEYMKTLRDNGKNFEKSCRRWQISCFLSVCLLFIALIAGTAVSMLFYYESEILTDKLSASSSRLAEMESQKLAALSKADNLMQTMDNRLKPYMDENNKLKERIDDLQARNDELRASLGENMNQQAALLQRISEKARLEEVTMADAMRIQDNAETETESDSF
jgi:excisionase family DNA binding protein